MAQYTVPIPGGGEYHVNASSPQAAYDNVGLPYNGGGSSGGGGGAAAPAASGGGQGALDSSLQKMLQALATGNAQAFEEQRAEFNKNYELAVAGITGTYQGNPTAAMQQFNAQLAQTASQFAQSFGLQQQGQAQQNAAQVAALTGIYNAPGGVSGGVQNAPTIADFQRQPADVQQTYNQYNNGNGAAKWIQDATAAMQAAGGQQGQSSQGVQTLAGQLQQAQLSGRYNGAPTEAARQFNAGMGSTLLQAATQLRGPKDYLQYQNLTHGGQSLLSQLYGNGQAGATAQPAGQLQSANLNNALGDVGWNPQAQGINVPQQGAGAGSQPDPTTQALLASFGLTPGGTLSPGQIDPARWDQIGQVGQDLTKNLASTYFGYDPNDFENQINATRPKGAASRTTAAAYARPQGLF